MVRIDSRVIISGAGFLADAYDLFVINIVVDLMAKCDYSQPLTNNTKATIKTMALLGAMLGQIGFGALADQLGRKRIFISTCMLVLFSALMSACVVNTSGGGIGIYNQLCFWRFLLGVGVGGEYPLSASVTTESSSSSNQITNLATVFAMQGVGTILCAIVLVIVTSIDTLSTDSQWRIALAFGGLPMVVAFYFRYTMHETLHTTSDSGKSTPPTPTSWSATWKVLCENASSLCGTAGCWLLLDIVFYANGLFSGQVTSLLHIVSSVPGEALAALILNCLAFPGYLLSIAFLARCGVKPMQTIGFLLTAMLFFLLSAFQPYLLAHPMVYLLCYGLTFLAQNFGPNATTYVLPSVLFRPTIRGTCHGLSSAAGKLGAVVGSQVFLGVARAFCPADSSGSSGSGDCGEAQQHLGIQLVFALCGLVALVGAGWTVYWIPDDPAIVGAWRKGEGEGEDEKDYDWGHWSFRLRESHQGGKKKGNYRGLPIASTLEELEEEDACEAEDRSPHDEHSHRVDVISSLFLQPHYRSHFRNNEDLHGVVKEEDLHL